MKNKKGSILVFALIVLSFILVTAFSLSAVSLIEKRSSGVSVNSATAFQNSDEGMEEFLQQLYKELDQNDDLTEMGSQLNGIYSSGGYTCIEPSGGGPARLGSQDTEFIITAYREDTAANLGNWDVTPIEDCGTSLADVSRFRATGNYNNASRAVFLKLRDSLTRGLVAHWAFEDRAQNSSLTDTDDEKNSFIVGDSSKNNYMLTLCDLNTGDNDADGNADDEIEVNVGDIDNDGIEDTHYIVPFANCSQSVDTGMNQHRAEDADGDSTYDCASDDYCEADGAWREGIVNESDGQAGGGVFGDFAKEALYFDGTDDYITALVDATECYGGSGGCDETINYVDDENAKRLDLEEGIAISAWVKREGDSGELTVISKWYDNEGYGLYTQGSDKICFKLNGTSLCEDHSGDIDSSEWAHVVATWRASEGKMRIFVNAEETTNDKNFTINIKVPADVPLSIGARLNDSNAMFDPFEGVIDDIRIWKRALTEDEVMRLCTDSVGDTNDDSVCDIP